MKKLILFFLLIGNLPTFSQESTFVNKPLINDNPDFSIIGLWQRYANYDDANGEYGYQSFGFSLKNNTNHPLKINIEIIAKLTCGNTKSLIKSINLDAYADFLAADREGNAGKVFAEDCSGLEASRGKLNRIISLNFKILSDNQTSAASNNLHSESPAESNEESKRISAIESKLESSRRVDNGVSSSIHSVTAEKQPTEQILRNPKSSQVEIIPTKQNNISAGISDEKNEVSPNLQPKLSNAGETGNKDLSVKISETKSKGKQKSSLRYGLTGLALQKTGAIEIRDRNAIKPYKPTKAFLDVNPNYLKDSLYRFPIWSRINSDRYPLRLTKFNAKEILPDFNYQVFFSTSIDRNFNYKYYEIAKGFTFEDYKKFLEIESERKHTLNHIYPFKQYSQFLIPKYPTDIEDNTIPLDRKNVFLLFGEEQFMSKLPKELKGQAPNYMIIYLKVLDFKQDEVTTYYQMIFSDKLEAKLYDKYLEVAVSSLLGQFFKDQTAISAVNGLG
ncbi:MAG: hypothetical protein EOP00_10550 [Pedobacter sp.]|nr:MAG: hypothetical protein EOP00_10550 [Pedobacter sp.]